VTTVRPDTGRLLLLLAVLAAAGVAAGEPAARVDPAPGAGPVLVLQWQGPIGPVSSAYLERGLAAARRLDASLVVLELDTPGGLDTAMRRMVQDILAAHRPVVVYVHPPGARAASAGVFVLSAAHVAAMAPSTSAGAAHPVSLGARMDSTMSAKVTNDAVALLEGLAVRRGRSTSWCRRVVAESAAVPADSALALGMVDLVAEDLPALLAALEGRRVAAGGDTVTIHATGARTVVLPPDFRERLLRALTNPELAYIFLMLGIYGLFFELSRPGAVLPGVVGAISLALAFLAFQQLPVDYVGVLLILLGVILLVLEVKITSYGLLTVAALGSLLLGTVLLFPGEGWRGVPWRTVLPIILFTAGFFLFIIGAGWRAQARPARTGGDALLGRVATVTRVDAAGRRGTLLLDGELWAFRSVVPVAAGDEVLVRDRDGLLLTVEPAAGPGEGGS